MIDTTQAPHTTDRWRHTNQRYLMAALEPVRAALAARDPSGAAHTPPAKDRQGEATTPPPDLDALRAEMASPPALETLCRAFRLSDFERAIVLLCAGIELDGSLAALCRAAHGHTGHTAPSFGLALATLPAPHWDALAPDAPLRAWRLVEIGPGQTLTGSALRLDERILHYLTGSNTPDERLAAVAAQLPAPESLVPTHDQLADQIAAIWEAAPAQLPVIQLVGAFADDARHIAAAACHRVGLGALAVRAADLPTDRADLETLRRLWSRETILNRVALVVTAAHLEPGDPARNRALTWLLERIDGPLIVTGRHRLPVPEQVTVAFDIARPTTAEQQTLWREMLDHAGIEHPDDDRLDTVAAQFDLEASAIRATVSEAASHLRAASPGANGAAPTGWLLWDTCRTRARPQLDDLAQRIETRAAWDDLILPEPQRATLREMLAHVRQRLTVYETWGFAEANARGLGISALFAGASGTGKTLAAEVLAQTLHLDLYRVDLSSVVSKYIGETEKNLRRIFDAADSGGVVLLFDEADALFGKRSEVKDSHDRHANIEVSYLLQRMEAYRGLAILTTNMKGALDAAFLRRLRFIVQFPFPDAAQRAAIWQRIFPPQTPTADLDIDRLAQLNVAGGSIRNIALNAAFLAADSGEAVTMDHILAAARGEYAKLEKTLTDSELRGWQ